MLRIIRHKKVRPIEFWVKAKTYELVESREKDLLVRAKDWAYDRTTIGDVVLIRAHKDKKELRCERRIIARRLYQRMTDVVNHEDLTRMAHGDATQTLSYLARIYRQDQQEGQAIVYVLAPLEEEQS